LLSIGGVLRSMLAVTVAAAIAYAFTFATVRSSDPESRAERLTDAEVATVYADSDEDQAAPQRGVQLASLETDVAETGSIPREALAMAPMSTDGALFDDRLGGGPFSSFEDRFGSSRRIPKAQIDAAAPVPRDAPKRQNARVAMLPSPANPLPVAPASSGAPSKAMPAAGARSDEIWASHGNKTAIYDISAKTVYLPNGEKLEAHSGLGEHMDDLRSVTKRMKGVTPPNVYELTERERLFHGVRAVRLNPVDRDRMFGRAGMLVHSYMLGPNGDSNGCISVKDYPRFLNAFLNGEIERVVVVDRLGDAPESEVGVAWLSNRLKSVASAIGVR